MNMMFYQLSCNLECWLQFLLSPCCSDHGFKLIVWLLIEYGVWVTIWTVVLKKISSSMIKRAHVEVCRHIRGRAHPTCPLCSSTRGKLVFLPTDIWKVEMVLKFSCKRSSKHPETRRLWAKCWEVKGSITGVKVHPPRCYITMPGNFAHCDAKLKATLHWIHTVLHVEVFKHGDKWRQTQTELESKSRWIFNTIERIQISLWPEGHLAYIAHDRHGNNQ